MIDLRYVKKLIEMIDESSVDSIEISTEKGIKIRIAKSPVQRGAVSVATPMPVPMPAVMPPAMLDSRITPAAGIPAPIENGASGDRGAERAASSHLEVKSPMVGTFYGAPEPGARPYVSVGDRVQKGQTLCIIEAMKIMNEIESEYSGVVKEILAQDAQPVEYGQVLFRIEPNG
ncbi:MAG TPA: acetyl-CoA carboxylase biotin carboxyl carrier protein [Gemmatimonadaceae bacterium]|nr:acetyl-CoA carboxylase biotin carboxyl carrier protein [Gemmatimonadaceae bacterium]